MTVCVQKRKKLYTMNNYRSFKRTVREYVVNGVSLRSATQTAPRLRSLETTRCSLPCARMTVMRHPRALGATLDATFRAGRMSCLATMSRIRHCRGFVSSNVSQSSLKTTGLAFIACRMGVYIGTCNGIHLLFKKRQWYLSARHRFLLHARI